MKATDAIKQHHELVEAVEDFLEKLEKSDKYHTSIFRHDAAMAKRNLQTMIKKYRLTKPKQKKAVAFQGGFNFIAK